MSNERISSFAEFWPYYVRAHSRRGTRILHGAGSVLALSAVVAALWLNPWLILLAPFIGYGFAWYGHFVVEHNRPATFGHPFWSLAADYRMLFLMLTGRMEHHVRESGATSAEDEAGIMSTEDL
ncbi:MAG: DUF962 domain-containing protein [Acidobacteria bacterium]|nr:DUF962 domain-containing protein [Acidobacteriota bacterium]